MCIRDSGKAVIRRAIIQHDDFQLLIGLTANACLLYTSTPEAKAELEANGVPLADYDSILDGMAAETEPQTVLAESATVNYAV